MSRFQFFFIISHLIPVLSHLCVSITYFLLCFSDAGGCVHTVCHDGGDQAELDRGFKEVYPAQQLSRPHTVITSSTSLTEKASTHYDLFNKLFLKCPLPLSILSSAASAQIRIAHFRSFCSSALDKYSQISSPVTLALFQVLYTLACADESKFH